MASSRRGWNEESELFGVAAVASDDVWMVGGYQEAASADRALERQRAHDRAASESRHLQPALRHHRDRGERHLGRRRVHESDFDGRSRCTGTAPPGRTSRPRPATATAISTASRRWPRTTSGQSATTATTRLAALERLPVELVADSEPRLLDDPAQRLGDPGRRGLGGRRQRRRLGDAALDRLSLGRSSRRPIPGSNFLDLDGVDVALRDRCVGGRRLRRHRQLADADDALGRLRTGRSSASPSPDPALNRLDGVSGRRPATSGRSAGPASGKPRAAPQRTRLGRGRRPRTRAPATTS